MKKMRVDYSKFVLAIVGRVLSTEGDWLPVHKVDNVLTDHPGAMSEKYEASDR